MLIYVPKRGIYETTKVTLGEIRDGEDSGKVAVYLTSGAGRVEVLAKCSQAEGEELLESIASKIAKVRMRQRGIVVFDPDEKLREMRGRRD